MRCISSLAGRFDLSVLQQSEPDRVDNNTMIEASLFDSGRPVCIVPYIRRSEMKLDRLVCCWDGSRPPALFQRRLATPDTGERRRSADSS
jgi:hypothetical protein